MISEDDVLEDPKDDDIGELLREIQAIQTWTRKRAMLRETLVTRLRKGRYISFVGQKRLWGGYRNLHGIGSSVVYQVPPHKRGHLKSFRGSLVRVVCVASWGRDTYTIMVGRYAPRALAGERMTAAELA